MNPTEMLPLAPLFDLSPLSGVFGSIAIGMAVSIGLGLVVGFLSAMFGIGGGFVVTPFFHSVLHLPAALAVASSMGQIALMSLSGIVAYARKRMIRYQAAVLLLIGAVPSSQVVALIFGNLRDSPIGAYPLIAGLSVADFALLLSFGLFLGLLGCYNVYRSFGYRTTANAEKAGSGPATRGIERRSTATPAAAEDARRPMAPLSRRASVITILVGIIFGVISALLGIGGGFLAVPYFVYALKFEPVEAVATSFLCILVTALLTTAHYILAGNIYFGLSIAVALGSILGAQLGSRFAIRVAPDRLLFSLGALQLIVVSLYVSLKFV